MIWSGLRLRKESGRSAESPAVRRQARTSPYHRRLEVRYDTDLYNLTVKTGHGAAVIHATVGHLFWAPYLHYGWIPANHLKPGMHLKTPDGQSAVVIGGSVPAVHDGWMWDLTVPGNNDHDFYVAVAATAVLVHNECTVDYTGSRGAGQDLKRTATVNGDQWQFNTGHGFDRVHTGPGGVQTDLRTTGLSADQIEQAIAGDVHDYIGNGGSIPGPGPAGPYQGSVNVDGYNIGYRAVQTRAIRR